MRDSHHAKWLFAGSHMKFMGETGWFRRVCAKLSELEAQLEKSSEETDEWFVKYSKHSTGLLSFPVAIPDMSGKWYMVMESFADNMTALAPCHDFQYRPKCRSHTCVAGRHFQDRSEHL